MEKFETFLLDSFADGIQYRELRLSKQEVHYVKGLFPDAKVEPSQTSTSADGKKWYEVRLTRFKENSDDLVISSHIKAIQKENLKLKQELSDLRKAMSLSSSNN